jgi:hypothetical protein
MRAQRRLTAGDTEVLIRWMERLVTGQRPIIFGDGQQTMDFVPSPPTRCALHLYTLAYYLGNFMRTLAMPKTAQRWSLTSLRETLIKIGAKVVNHGRYVTFQMAEVAVPRRIVQGYPDADFPVAGAARASVAGRRGQM